MAAGTLRLEGKTAVVTGGSQGIGRAILILLAKDGANVGVNFSRNVDKANEVVAEIERDHKGGIKNIAVQADVSKASAVKELFDKAEAAFGKVNIVGHSAGTILTNFPSLVETTEEEWDWMAAVNTKGAFLVSREPAKRIPPGDGGRIVNVTTTLVSTALPGNAAYSASKAAVECFTKSLAKELKREADHGQLRRPWCYGHGSLLHRQIGRYDRDVGESEPFGALGRALRHRQCCYVCGQ